MLRLSQKYIHISKKSKNVSCEEEGSFRFFVYILILFIANFYVRRRRSDVIMPINFLEEYEIENVSSRYSCTLYVILIRTNEDYEDVFTLF